MTQLDTKERVLEATEERHKGAVALARSLAVEAAEMNGGLCSIEDIRSLAQRRGLAIDFSGNWTGAIFRDRQSWEYVDMVQSRHEGGHARRVMRWRLLPGARVQRVEFLGPRQLDLISA